MTDIGTNIKPRLVKCLWCAIERRTDEPAPKCERCGSKMVTIIK